MLLKNKVISEMSWGLEKAYGVFSVILLQSGPLKLSCSVKQNSSEIVIENESDSILRYFSYLCCILNKIGLLPPCIISMYNL